MPKDGDNVMVTFMYMGKEVTHPATYRNGKFIISFYTSEIPVIPITWEAINKQRESDDD